MVAWTKKSDGDCEQIILELMCIWVETAAACVFSFKVVDGLFEKSFFELQKKFGFFCGLIQKEGPEGKKKQMGEIGHNNASRE